MKIRTFVAKSPKRNSLSNSTKLGGLILLGCISLGFLIQGATGEFWEWYLNSHKSTHLYMKNSMPEKSKWKCTIKIQSSQQSRRKELASYWLSQGSRNWQSINKLKKLFRNSLKRPISYFASLSPQQISSRSMWEFYLTWSASLSMRDISLYPTYFSWWSNLTIKTSRIRS